MQTLAQKQVSTFFFKHFIFFIFYFPSKTLNCLLHMCDSLPPKAKIRFSLIKSKSINNLNYGVNLKMEQLLKLIKKD